ncbi:hypothetical protein MIR68_000297 [Amoeboaphelidium protococcarum]|nr:hypothetical protein MIR68_000297 [Amoeboaphelidium protococcarum]
MSSIQLNQDNAIHGDDYAVSGLEVGSSGDLVYRVTQQKGPCGILKLHFEKCMNLNGAQSEFKPQLEMIGQFLDCRINNLLSENHDQVLEFKHRQIFGPWASGYQFVVKWDRCIPYMQLVGHNQKVYALKHIKGRGINAEYDVVARSTEMSVVSSETVVGNVSHQMRCVGCHCCRDQKRVHTATLIRLYQNQLSEKYVPMFYCLTIAQQSWRSLFFFGLVGAPVVVLIFLAYVRALPYELASAVTGVLSLINLICALMVY